MSKRRTLAFIALAVIAVMALFLVAACGDEEESTGGDDGGTGELTGTAAERAAEILGREPTGLAADIVNKGEVIVANDANYAPQSSIDKATGELVGFDVDVATKMAEILGLTVKFENPAWETIPAGLNQGSYDVSIGSMTSAIDGDKAANETLVGRWDKMDFTEPYYYTSGQLFVKTGGEQVTDPASSTASRSASAPPRRTTAGSRRRQALRSRPTRPTPTPSPTCATATSTSS